MIGFLKIAMEHFVLTRGYLIGEIVDDLAALGNQVKMRNAIHMFDMTVVAENFFKDVLNILLDAKFKNLNDERSNEPGLDLGEDTKRIGIQITSSASTQKVNKTLENITTVQGGKFDKFYVLGMNKRQQSYSIDPKLGTKYSFTEDNIWDLDTLARKAMDLEFDELKRLYDLVRSNTTKLKIDLEIPDENGNYTTSGYDLWEKRLAPKLGDGTAFMKYYEDVIGEASVDLAGIQKGLKELGDKLTRLPRITREFLATLYERREERESKRFRGEGWSHLLLDKVKREYGGGDLDGEFAILEDAGFLAIDGEDPDYYGPPMVGITLPLELEELAYSFVAFVEEKQLSYRRVIGSNDLSAF